MKTIVAVKNTKNKGKTKTLRNVALEISNLSPTPVLVFENPVNGLKSSQKDITVVFDYKGKIIVVATMGDPSTDLKGRLDSLINTYNPVLIFCATRTTGDTWYDVDDLRKTYGYDLIRTSTHENNDPQTQDILNHEKAKHLVQLVQTLGVI